MSKAGPASMARGWRHAHAVLSGEKPGDRAWAERTIVMLERRLPDVGLRCSKCGRLHASADAVGPRCSERMARLAG